MKVETYKYEFYSQYSGHLSLYMLQKNCKDSLLFIILSGLIMLSNVWLQTDFMSQLKIMEAQSRMLWTSIMVCIIRKVNVLLI